jgi:2-amino-4-hydroxy-6-hydroxymethyldihydropteridine diphosphokinase
MQTAYIGMGANLASSAGPPESTLAAAVLRLESLGHVVCRSSLYSTEPVGFAEQPRFVNAVIALETELQPRELLDGLLAIEQEFGRNRATEIANGPRTLDLDILLLGNVKINEPGLEVPHPRLAARAFMLVPLCEIAPEAFDPRTENSVTQLLHGLIPNLERKNNAVVQIESDGWRAGAGRVDDCPGVRERAIDCDRHD